MGALHEIAFSTTGNPSYIALAKQYYEEGETLGPNRPQTLYGLFDVYRAMGDVTDAQAVAAKILADWPSDTTVPQALSAFLTAVKGATTSATSSGK